MAYNQFESRNFNRMSVNESDGTITKTSAKKQKLLDEANWYRSLPVDLAGFAPKLHDVIQNDNDVSIVMELFPYPNLASLWLNSGSDFNMWANIIRKLFDIHHAFEKHTTAIDKSEYEYIYREKTIERIDKMRESNPVIADMMTGDDITINNHKYRNLSTLKTDIFNWIDKLIAYDRRTIVHGDFCFSNILMNPGNNSFRLVDPRGGFGKTSIYGDPRYDIAKLRHSFIGLYDFIIGDLFELKSLGDNSFVFHIDADMDIDKYEQYFDRIATEYGFDSNDIKFIESLLFLTMIPLHADKPAHQQAFYLIAIKKLNEVINGK